jgi:predicted O-linked N-acetylglucosamine transferase (SPINDLY family)
MADRLIAEGNRAEGEGRLAEACELYRKAVQAAPDYAKAHVNLGIGLEAQGDLDGAMRCFEDALAADADDPFAGYNLGNHLYRRGELERAERLFRAALRARPDFAEALVMLANVLDSRGEAAAAFAALESAVRLRADYASLFFRQRCESANSLVRQGRLEQAVERYREALRFKADSLDAQYGLAAALRHLGRHDEATAAFETAMRLTPHSAQGYYQLANAFRDADRNGEALDCLRRAIALDPEYADARRALAMYQLPAVHGPEDPQQSRAAFSRELEALDHWYDATRGAKGFESVGNVQPFLLAYHEADNRELLQRHGGLCSRLMGAWADAAALPRPARGSGGAVRVGVVSNFFSNHSVWSAIVLGWFAQLDRERVALHAFYLRTQEDDETRFAASRAAHFESGSRDLRAWADAILRQRLDVIIYPEIGMDAMTLKLASLRLAPVQAATWGHPQTTGLPTIDYYLSAAAFEPDDAQSHYSERLVALPGVGCHYSAKALPQAEPVGLDSTRPLAVCPGAPFKYAPQHDALLVEIARRAGCRLVFFTFNVNPDLSRKLRQRLEQAFARRSLKLDDYSSFIPWQSGPAFFGVLGRASVFLDTIGFSGFNTAMHAVQCTLPIVARDGRFMRGRLASGILKRMGLGELVAASDDEYLSLAVKLMAEPAYRESIRKRMRVAQAALFEDLAPIRALEQFLAGLARA